MILVYFFQSVLLNARVYWELGEVDIIVQLFFHAYEMNITRLACLAAQWQLYPENDLLSLQFSYPDLLNVDCNWNGVKNIHSFFFLNNINMFLIT